MTNAVLTHKVCSKCAKNKPTKDYYVSASDTIHSDSRLGICKTCLESVAQVTNAEHFIGVLRQIDRPFIKKEYDASLPYKNPFREYMRRIGMPQNKSFTYLDSSFEGSLEHLEAKSSSEFNKKVTLEDKVKFKISPETLVKWGSNYSETELYQLETFYNSMITANSINTPQHKEQLKLLCKLNLEQNKALDEGKINDFKNLNTQYNKILENSGFRPIDKVSGGESIGIRTFSQIWEEIEKDGFIEPYPYEEKQDIIDKTIMYMGNYTRKLLNMQSMSEPPEDTPQVEGDYE